MSGRNKPPGYNPSDWANKRKTAMEKAAKLRAARKNHVDSDHTFKPQINKNSTGNKPPDIKPYGWKDPSEDNPPDALDEFNATAGEKLNVRTGASMGDDIPIKPASSNIYETAGGGMPLMSPSGDALTKEVRNRNDVKAKPRRRQQKPEWSFDTDTGEGAVRDELDSHSNFDGDMNSTGRRSRASRERTPPSQDSGIPQATSSNWNHKHTRALPGVGEDKDWMDQMRNIPTESPRLNVRGGLPRGDSSSHLAPGSRVPTANLALLKKKLSSRGVSRSKSAASAQKKVGRRRSAHRAQTTPPRPDNSDINPSNFTRGAGMGGHDDSGPPAAQPSIPQRSQRPRRRAPQQQRFNQELEEEEMMREQESPQQQPPQPKPRQQPRKPRRPRPGSGPEVVEEAAPSPGAFNSNSMMGGRPDSSRNTLEMAAPDGGVVDTTLYPCSDCGRKFNAKALSKHQKNCKKVFVEKRKAFNTQAQRITGKEQEKLIKQAKRKEVQEKRAAKNPRSFDDQPIKAKKESKWKSQSNALREAMKQQRLIAKYEKEGKSLSELPAMAAPSAPDPSLQQCPHCNRRFNEKAAARHIPKCATIINKPKTLQRGARVGLGAAARKADPVSKAKARRNRPFNR